MFKYVLNVFNRALRDGLMSIYQWIHNITIPYESPKGFLIHIIFSTCCSPSDPVKWYV